MHHSKPETSVFRGRVPISILSSYNRRCRKSPMKLINEIFSTEPAIIHFPYHHSHPIWNRLVRHSLKNSDRYEVPDGLKVFTFNNRPVPMLLEQVAAQHGVQTTVLGRTVQYWVNRLKIKLCLDFLEHVEEPYVLGLDDDDVILLQDAPQLAFNRFLQNNCKALYNASSVAHPNVSKYKEVDVQLVPDSIFAHLNSGCFIGETKFLREVYREAAAYNDADTQLHFKSDQVKIRPIYHKLFPDLKIDSRCEIFQILYINPAFDQLGFKLSHRAFV